MKLMLKVYNHSAKLGRGNEKKRYTRRVPKRKKYDRLFIYSEIILQNGTLFANMVDRGE